MDDDLRAAERRWRASGQLVDLIAYLTARLRADDAGPPTPVLVNGLVYPQGLGADIGFPIDAQDEIWHPDPTRAVELLTTIAAFVFQRHVTLDEELEVVGGLPVTCRECASTATICRPCTKLLVDLIRQSGLARAT